MKCSKTKKLSVQTSVKRARVYQQSPDSSTPRVCLTLSTAMYKTREDSARVGKPFYPGRLSAFNKNRSSHQDKTLKAFEIPKQK